MQIPIKNKIFVHFITDIQITSNIQRIRRHTYVNHSPKIEMIQF